LGASSGRNPGLAFFVNTMATFKLYFILSEENRKRLAQIYKDITDGKELKPPKKDKRAVHLEAKLESPEEMAEIMQESPPYSVDVQGREG
jgi:hypothetical protein